MDSQRINPLYDRVVVKRLESEQTTASGIIIPDTAKEKAQYGQVVSCGPGKAEGGSVRPLAVKAGDKILFGKYAGTEIKLDNVEYLVIKEEEVLGIIK